MSNPSEPLKSGIYDRAFLQITAIDAEGRVEAYDILLAG